MATNLSARKLLLEVRNDFNSCVDADSLIAVFEQRRMLKKKEKKRLGRPDADVNTKNTLLFHKMYNSEETSSPLSATEVIQLLEETKNERNILFSKTLHSILCTMAKDTTPSLPPFKYHYPLNDNPSAIFSSSGGVLYSPVYGVMVYIPAGAILGEDQVEVSFQLVTAEAEIREFLSQIMFKGSVVCSGVFEFEAKLVEAPEGAKFDAFHSEVWIELPHCLSFGGSSLKDYSTAFVVSDSRGKVTIETQALFSEGYPYVNLPVRHFSRFCVSHSPKKRFSPSRDETSVAHLRRSMQKLHLSRSIEDDQFSTPHTHSNQFKQWMMESATHSTAEEKRSRYIETKKASSEASAEEQQRQGLLRQDASANLSDEAAMEVDPPASISSATSASLQQEDFNVLSTKLSIMARVCQPEERNQWEWWTARIVFALHLPETYEVLGIACQMHSVGIAMSCAEIVACIGSVQCTRQICFHNNPCIKRGPNVYNLRECTFTHFCRLWLFLKNRHETNVAPMCSAWSYRQS